VEPKTCERGNEEILEQFRVLQTAEKKCKGERERESVCEWRRRRRRF
jgi:hypothetical protein